MLLRHRRGRIDWVLGEAKSAGGEITQEDLTHMKAIANALRKIDVRPYLAFSKTADGSQRPSLASFARHAPRGRVLRKESRALALVDMASAMGSSPEGPKRPRGSASALDASRARSCACAGRAPGLPLVYNNLKQQEEVAMDAADCVITAPVTGMS
jgi:hypothetical protein